MSQLLEVITLLPSVVSGLSSPSTTTTFSTSLTMSQSQLVASTSLSSSSSLTAPTAESSSIVTLQRTVNNKQTFEEKEKVQQYDRLYNLIDTTNNGGGIRHCEIGWITTSTKDGHGYSRYRGLIVTKDMKPNECVLQIPMSIIGVQTTTTTTTLTPKEGEEQNELSGIHKDSWAGRLAYQLLNFDNDKSCIYKQSLPKPPSVPSSITRTHEGWSMDVLNEFQNPMFVDDIRNEQEWKYQQLQSQNIRPDVDDEHSQKFLDCLDLVCSRTIRTGRHTFQLVPLLDMANHACRKEGGGYYQLTSDGTAINLYVGERRLKKGDEMTLDYGIRTNEEWMLHYGFLPSRNTEGEQIVLLNKSKRIVVTWDDVGSRSKRHNDDDETTLLLRQECYDLLHNKEIHPTTLEEDIQLRRQQQQQQDYRLQMAINYRISRKILLSAIASGGGGVTKTDSSSRSAFSSFSFQ